MKKDETTKPAPWWTHGHVWLLIAGPALVVIASVITAWIAVRNQDPVLTDKAMLPALQGRNHAATTPQ
jgi:uncharacterized protein